MTVCPICKGRGTVGYFHIDHFVDIECDRCHGSGEVSETDMTNEEYLKTCTTEQLAEWMASVVQKAISIKENNGIVMLESAIWWEEWLKQQHK